MNITDRYAISKEVHHFLEMMGFGVRHISPDSLRVIMNYAILAYLNNHRTARFPIDVAIALHNQTAVELTPDMEAITWHLQELKEQKKTPEETRKLLTEFMEIIEEEHYKDKTGKHKNFDYYAVFNLSSTSS